MVVVVSSEYQRRYAATMGEIPELLEHGVDLAHLLAEARAQLFRLEPDSDAHEGQEGYVDALSEALRAEQRGTR